MTGPAYDAKVMAQIDQQLKDAGTDGFDYDRTVDSTGSTTVDSKLDPRSHNAQRFCRDQPGVQKEPITLVLDVTGSLREAPKYVRADLPQLMGLLTIQDFSLFPDIQFAFVGDCRSDSTPMQIGQFESGAVEIDASLRSAILEGGGGGHGTESYTEMLWYMAFRNHLDCWARGERGTLVIVGDEMTYDYAYAKYINQHFRPEPSEGVKQVADLVTADVPRKTIFDELLKKYRVYFILPGGTQGWDMPVVDQHWKALIGDENVIRLRDPKDISEMVAALVLWTSGVKTDRIKTELVAIGSSINLVNEVSKALTVIGNATTTMAPPPHPSKKNKGVKRI